VLGTENPHHGVYTFVRAARKLVSRCEATAAMVT
jgi:hypothetical protein